MKAKLGQFAVISVTVIALAGCEEGQGPNFGGPTAPDGQTTQVQREARTEIRDVEAPEVFSRTEEALWDGRPSLGGIWVAHPDVDAPERAIIRNEKTGKSIPGALFRRERNNPGPRFQLSSEAAAALSILAGQPTEITVIAVRQEEIEIEPAPLPISEEIPGEEDLPPIDETSADEPASEPEDDDGSAATTAALATGATAAAVAADEAPRPGFWQRFRESLRRDPKPASDIALEADTSALEETTASAEVPAVDTRTLAPVTAVAAAAIDEAEARQAPPARPAQAAQPAQPVRTATSPLKNPFVQVGLFSVEANASSVATSLRQAGIVPTVDASDKAGKTTWRVLVGPMNTTAEQAQILTQVRGQGYADAFLVPN